ncbi:DUF2190 family protein [Cereibacter sediminicola]|uniref:DUF2190 family protein n=1 Tax=Cereibacter sediminicola TaxID=2584941 RepID=UPI00119E1862|nr:DUF2190 family protein [Cereibacter sediminicola]
MKNFVQPGNTVTIPAPYAVLSGQGVKSGLIFGVACGDAAEAADVDVQTVGVFDLAKVGTDTFALGAAVYWDATAQLATATATGNSKIGAALEAASNTAATVRVRLNGAF